MLRPTDKLALDTKNYTLPGMAFHRISPDGENLDDQDSPDVTEIQKAVSAWTNGLLKALQSNNMDAGLG